MVHLAHDFLEHAFRTRKYVNAATETNKETRIIQAIGPDSATLRSTKVGIIKMLINREPISKRADSRTGRGAIVENGSHDCDVLECMNKDG